jgi:hypothetical protein
VRALVTLQAHNGKVFWSPNRAGSIGGVPGQPPVLSATAAAMLEQLKATQRLQEGDLSEGCLRALSTLPEASQAGARGLPVFPFACRSWDVPAGVRKVMALPCFLARRHGQSVCFAGEH